MRTALPFALLLVLVLVGIARNVRVSAQEADQFFTQLGYALPARPMRWWLRVLPFLALLVGMAACTPTPPRCALLDVAYGYRDDSLSLTRDFDAQIEQSAKEGNARLLTFQVARRDTVMRALATKFAADYRNAEIADSITHTTCTR